MRLLSEGLKAAGLICESRNSAQWNFEKVKVLFLDDATLQFLPFSMFPGVINLIVLQVFKDSLEPC